MTNYLETVLLKTLCVLIQTAGFRIQILFGKSGFRRHPRSGSVVSGEKLHSESVVSGDKPHSESVVSGDDHVRKLFGNWELLHTDSSTF